MDMTTSTDCGRGGRHRTAALCALAILGGLLGCTHATGGTTASGPAPDPGVALAPSALPVDSSADNDLIRDRVAEGKRQGMIDSLERVARDADASGASAGAKVKAHASLLGMYRGIDYDRGIETHAAAILRLLPQVSADDRVKYAYAFIESVSGQAEVAADKGDMSRAIAVLRNAGTTLAGVPDKQGVIADARARYELVGTHAPAVTAAYWVKGPAGTSTLDLGAGGPVTIVEMTAWWCGSCRRSYPWIRHVLRHYGDSVRVVLATNLMGRFHQDTGLTPAVEREKLTTYFTVDRMLPATVAIADAPAGWDQGANDKAYHVYGIPQMAIISRDGVIHRLIEGWDPHNEAMYDAEIAALIHSGATM
jgi:hypothetical protein